MKIFMIVDLEGVNTVVTYKHQAAPDGKLYPEARRILMGEVNAAVAGCIKGGAESVTIYDTHYYGLNLIPAELHPKAMPILGKPYKNQLDASYGGLILLGFHAMAETPGALLPHSYSLDIKSIYINDIKVGEIGMEAALASELGIPLIMVCGDHMGIKEAKEISSGMQTVITKYAITEESASCRPIKEVNREIRVKSEIAVKKIHKNEYKKLTKFKSPYLLKFEFNQKTGSLKKRCVEFKGKSLGAIWLEARKLLKI